MRVRLPPRPPWKDASRLKRWDIARCVGSTPTTGTKSRFMQDSNQQSNITIEPLDSLNMSASQVAVKEPSAEGSSQNEKISYEDASIQEIEVNKISPNPFQPRKFFDESALRELAASIKEHGVIQPLVVSPTPSGYELVVGERRFRAAQLAGLLKVPAIVKVAMVDQTKLEMALIENIQRKDLNPIEEAQAYERLIKTFNLTQEEVARKVGRSRPAVANTIRLLNLPAEVQRAIIEGKLTEGHGRALLGLVDPEKIILMTKQILEKGWTVRDVELRVRELTNKKRLDAAAPDPKLMALESELRTKFGTQVRIQKGDSGAGRITIEFFSEEELAEIVAKMAEKRALGEEQGYLTV